MTYFWIQLVHFGVVLVGKDLGQESSDPNFSPTSTLIGESDLSDELKLKEKDSRLSLPSSPFAAFLLANLYLADPTLWERYYSRQLMLSPGAKEAMVLPDKAPLPSIKGRDCV